MGGAGNALNVAGLLAFVRHVRIPRKLYSSVLSRQRQCFANHYDSLTRAPIKPEKTNAVYTPAALVPMTGWIRRHLVFSEKSKKSLGR